MKKIPNIDELCNEIKLLEQKKADLRAVIGKDFHDLHESFSLHNIIRSSLGNLLPKQLKAPDTYPKNFLVKATQKFLPSGVKNIFRDLLGRAVRGLFH